MLGRPADHVGDDREAGTTQRVEQGGRGTVRVVSTEGDPERDGRLLGHGDRLDMPGSGLAVHGDLFVDCHEGHAERGHEVVAAVPVDDHLALGGVTHLQGEVAAVVELDAEQGARGQGADVYLIDEVIAGREVSAQGVFGVHDVDSLISMVR